MQRQDWRSSGSLTSTYDHRASPNQSYPWVNTACQTENGWQHGGTEIRCVFEIMFVKMPVKPSSVQLSSVAQSCPTLCYPWITAIRPPCPSPTPGVHSNSCPLSRWCHPAISSSVIPFSCCPQSLWPSGSFPMSQIFAWGGQNIEVSASASILPMNTQDWSPLGCTGWISLQSKGLSRVFSNTTVQKYQFFGAQLSSTH